MARARSIYQCEACGARTPKWVGQCPECQGWNTLVELRASPSSAASAAGGRPIAHPGGHAGVPGGAVLSGEAVAAEPLARLSTGIGELDRVLGGGLVAGSSTVIGGEPGIGKSTLLLQALAAMSAPPGEGAARETPGATGQDELRPPGGEGPVVPLPAPAPPPDGALPPGGHRVLYVTGEESLGQVMLRARRAGLPVGGLRLYAQTGLEDILHAAAAEQPRVLVIDSIQTLHTERLGSAPGGVAQVRECAAELVRFARQAGTALVLVGHVTKDGAIAGPRVLEHMVDAVLYFESEAGSRFRALRAVKNRFGAANELGLFAMTDRGLREVSNPSAIFLSGGSGGAPGSVVTVTREGTRPLLVEVQALVDTCAGAQPRRLTVGLDATRLSMLLAVANRHAGVSLHGEDVFVNVVGGVRLTEPGADLPVLAAVVSSLRECALPRGWVLFGEVGLTGEIRPVVGGEERLREAAKHGFRGAIVPAANRPRRGWGRGVEGLRIHAVARVEEALEIAREPGPDGCS